MSVTISKKLSNSFEGALAGGGDPASSPLYVFGPFIRLITIAGVASITFGASVWMAVFSVIVVSAMYRQVMRWVTDGSGGSGLSEEEFGSWAVKITAGISIIEYILTFLVSIAALVTFIADRFAWFNDSVMGLQYRTLLAIVLSIFTCWLVNLGPKVSARTFGPATAAVLLLLWGMVFTAIYKTGFHLPDLNFQAFSLDKIPSIGKEEASSYLHMTFGGYARILALMTGIEIFANLVAAYDGKRAERSRKAFGSLVIIMGTTAVTMLIVGPVILAHSDPMNEHVSVFTQTMDFLLPPWLSYTGTLIGVAVLLSSGASAAQGVQNLALGLRHRHYIAAKFGQRNKHDVADLPIWGMAAICSVCYLLFGTKEDTYLALYAAGVFILLSLTGWAASKRLLREVREEFSNSKLLTLIGTVIASILTSFATVIIFEERFFEGAWSYLIMVPLCYMVFSYYRRHLGAPPTVEDRLGLIVSGQGYVPRLTYDNETSDRFFKKILITLDGGISPEKLLSFLQFFAREREVEVELLLLQSIQNRSRSDLLDYLNEITALLRKNGFPTQYKLAQGNAVSLIDRRALAIQADLILLFGSDNITDREAHEVIKRTLIPTLIIAASKGDHIIQSQFKRMLVALDGSEAAESVLPYICMMARYFSSNVLLLSVPEGSESEGYSDIIQRYLDDIAASLKTKGIDVSTFALGSGPARTILAMADAEKADLIMMASHGRGGIARPKIHLGSVAEKVIEKTEWPIFMVPLTRSMF